MHRILLRAALLLLLVACEKQPTPAPSSSGTTAPLPAATRAVPASIGAVSDDELSTEEDFEEEAEREISVKDIEAELDRLEKEIQ